MTRLILASSSPYRKELLERLHIKFECISPNIDESSLENEQPGAYVQRLAIEKAAEIGKTHADSLIIGSDQCCVNDNIILGKPKDRNNAIEQLRAASGKEIRFLTAVSIQHPSSNWHREWVDVFTVEFRKLSMSEIDRYLDVEQPFDSAGSFKSEKLGISLCESMHGDDPTALIGLPLISVAQYLREFGLQVP
ncbi:MAG: nucleoside triphosphate pyrophosphatase [Gammaproteobacteria bacterium]|nr:nucleoside triphosphate pyrophosphatase [Gammaproteobacteria bacterium]